MTILNLLSVRSSGVFPVACHIMMCRKYIGLSLGFHAKFAYCQGRMFDLRIYIVCSSMQYQCSARNDIECMP